MMRNWEELQKYTIHELEEIKVKELERIAAEENRRQSLILEILSLQQFKDGTGWKA